MNPENININFYWTKKQIKRFEELQKDPNAILAYWNSDDENLPCNGGSRRIKQAAPGVIHRGKKDSFICRPGMLHATFSPDAWAGTKVWVVALFGNNIQFDRNKLSAYKREIIGEASQDKLSIQYVLSRRNANYASHYSEIFTSENLSATIIAHNFYNCDLLELSCSIEKSYFGNCNISSKFEEVKGTIFKDCDLSKSKFDYIKDSYFYKCKLPKKFRKSEWITCAFKECITT